MAAWYFDLSSVSCVLSSRETRVHTSLQIQNYHPEAAEQEFVLETLLEINASAGVPCGFNFNQNVNS